jgi:hypothetical protein
VWKLLHYEAVSFFPIKQSALRRMSFVAIKSAPRFNEKKTSVAGFNANEIMVSSEGKG